MPQANVNCAGSSLLLKKAKQATEATCFVLAPPIFPGRRQPSIVGRNELNYRVRNGNGWTLVLISTNFVGAKSALLLCPSSSTKI